MTPWLHQQKRKAASANDLSERAEKSALERYRFISNAINTFDVETFWLNGIYPELEKAADNGSQEYKLPQRFLDSKLSGYIPKSVPHVCFYNKIIDHAESLGFKINIWRDIWIIGFSKPKKEEDKSNLFWIGILFVIFILLAIIIYVW